MQLFLDYAIVHTLENKYIHKIVIQQNLKDTINFSLNY